MGESCEECLMQYASWLLFKCFIVNSLEVLLTFPYTGPLLEAPLSKKLLSMVLSVKEYCTYVLREESTNHRSRTFSSEIGQGAQLADL